MGEWSEYFEDFPEENPANLVNGQFNPTEAARLRMLENQKTQVAQESKALQKKMFDMAAEAKQLAEKSNQENSSKKP